ncbi:hypothetical protein RI367_003641 [Sorochytrium milnesiophthora]
MRQLDSVALLEDEIHNLRLKLDLLEGDRKAYHEASQNTIRTNKDEIVKLRAQQKSLHESVSRLRKLTAMDRQDSAVALAAEDKVNQRAHESHKKHDYMLASVREKELKVTALQDELREATIEASSVVSKREECRSSKATQALENRLDRANIKFNETQTVRKTYDEIVELFHQEQLRYDRDLETFEKTLKVKRKEAADLESMRRDADHAKEMVRTELVKIEERITADRKFRSEDLQRRKEAAKHEMESSQMLEIKSLMTTNVPVTNVNVVNPSTEADVERERKLQEMEERLRRVKEATGVSDLNEVLDKLTKQKETHAQLTDLRDNCERRLKGLRETKKNLHKELEEARLNAEGKHANGKKVFEQMEAQLRMEVRKAESSKRNLERELAVLAKIKSGVAHLATTLNHVLGDERLSGDISEATMLSKFRLCSERIEELLTKVHNRHIKVDGELHSIPVNVPALNTRITMRTADFERLSDDGHQSAEGEEDSVLDREAMKRESDGMILMKKNKGHRRSHTKRRKGRGGRRGGGSDSSDDSSEY